MKGGGGMKARVQAREPAELASGLPGLREEGAGCWPWATAALARSRARLRPRS